MDRTRDGRPVRMLTLIDEYTRECLAIDVSRQIKAVDVVEQLADLFIFRGFPEYIRSDNGPEFVSGKLRDEPLNREIFDTLFEAKVLAERWRMEYNTFRPHSALGYRPPAPEAVALS